MSTSRWEDDEGQISVLILGVLALVLTLSAVIIGATMVNLEARRLVSAADGAATAAAASTEVGGGTSPSADAADVRAAAQAHLTQTGLHQTHAQLNIDNAWVSDGGETVHVELSAVTELPVLRWVLPAEVTVTADSHARVTVNR